MMVLVTGGAGFIGSHLVERLVSLNHTVYVIDDLSNGFEENLSKIRHKIVLVKHDVSEPFPNGHPSNLDVIFHLACHPRSLSFQNPYRDVDVNVKGTIHMARIAQESKAKIIFSSNSGIYDCSKIPVSEQNPDSPRTPYDLNKLTAENYLKLYDVSHTIFRFGTVYGPRQRTSQNWKPVIAEFIDKLSKNRSPTISGDGKQTRDFVYVGDVVDALVKSIDAETEGPIILGSGVETSINKLYEMISKALGVNTLPTFSPSPQGEIMRMRYDCKKARDVLNWKAKNSLKEGIAKTLEASR